MVFSPAGSSSWVRPVQEAKTLLLMVRIPSGTVHTVSVSVRRQQMSVCSARLISRPFSTASAGCYGDSWKVASLRN